MRIGGDVALGGSPGAGLEPEGLEGRYGGQHSARQRLGRPHHQQRPQHQHPATSQAQPYEQQQQLQLEHQQEQQQQQPQQRVLRGTQAALEPEQEQEVAGRRQQAHQGTRQHTQRHAQPQHRHQQTGKSSSSSSSSTAAAAEQVIGRYQLSHALSHAPDARALVELLAEAVARPGRLDPVCMSAAVSHCHCAAPAAG